MLGWVSPISRTLSRSVASLDRALGTRKSPSSRSSELTADPRDGTAPRRASAAGNDDTAHEWQTAQVGKAVPRWKTVAERQAVPEWKSAPAAQAVPEWKTDFWKRRVEGEAKKHFDGEIAGVCRHRS